NRTGVIAGAYFQALLRGAHWPGNAYGNYFQLNTNQLDDSGGGSGDISNTYIRNVNGFSAMGTFSTIRLSPAANQIGADKTCGIYFESKGSGDGIIWGDGTDDTAAIWLYVSGDTLYLKSGNSGTPVPIATAT
ncbi:unnamed protein product, partial [marine sediment metagenome]